MTALYNDNDTNAAAWLRELIADGHLPPGEVSTVSIKELTPDECAETSHFFAGIGGWPLALDLAGWPTGRPVWTGSCPCQPFSAAGKRAGTDDPRHLWPDFLRLVRECRPPVIFGEQVASADGRAWLAGVRADLEALGYAVGAADLCSAGVGAPHIRQRLYWGAKRLADVSGAGLEGRGGMLECPNQRPVRPGGMGSENGGIRDPRRSWRLAYCRDNRWRRVPVEPALFPLADGLPGRVGLLRGAGNAIDPHLAARFVRAFIEAAG